MRNQEVFKDDTSVLSTRLAKAELPLNEMEELRLSHLGKELEFNIFKHLKSQLNICNY
jgi:hypothetical protein